jgi:hypothetical protein
VGQLLRSVAGVLVNYMFVFGFAVFCSSIGAAIGLILLLLHTKTLRTSYSTWRTAEEPRRASQEASHSQGGA